MSFEFLNYTASDSHDVVAERHLAYRNYLVTNRKSFPSEAYEFAAADWHYDPTDNRCPHDSWLDNLSIFEEKISSDSDERGLKIKVTLLGAYHDGRIEITYTKVTGYDIRLLPNASYQSKWHGDWLIDEIRLSTERHLIHEIKFWLGGEWQIECENIVYKWLPDKMSA